MSQITLKLKRSSFIIGDTILSKLVHVIFIGASLTLPSILLISLIDLNYSLALTYLIIYVVVTLVYLAYNYTFLNLIPKEPPGFASLLQFSFVITLIGLLNMPQNGLLLAQRSSTIVFFGTFFILLILAYFGYWAFATRKRMLTMSLIFLALLELLILIATFLALVGQQIYIFQPPILLFLTIVSFIFAHIVAPRYRTAIKLILTNYVFLILLFFNNVFTAPIAIIFLTFSFTTSVLYLLKKYNVRLDKSGLKFKIVKLTTQSLIYSGAILLLNLVILINCLPLFFDMVELIHLESGKILFNSAQSILLGNGVLSITNSLPFIFNLFVVGGLVTVFSFVYYISSPYLSIRNKYSKLNQYLLIFFTLLLIAALVILDHFVLTIVLFFAFFILNFLANQKFQPTISLSKPNFLVKVSYRFIGNEYRAKQMSFLLLTILIVIVFVLLSADIFRI